MGGRDRGIRGKTYALPSRSLGKVEKTTQIRKAKITSLSDFVFGLGKVGAFLSKMNRQFSLWENCR